MRETTEPTDPAPAAAEEPKPKATRTSNPELQVMAKIDRLLAHELPDDAARNRVVAWITGFHSPKAGG